MHNFIWLKVTEHSSYSKCRIFILFKVTEHSSTVDITAKNKYIVLLVIDYTKITLAFNLRWVTFCNSILLQIGKKLVKLNFPKFSPILIRTYVTKYISDCKDILRQMSAISARGNFNLFL